MRTTKEHLGDSVYATIDDVGLTITVEERPNLWEPIETIHIELELAERLVSFIVATKFISKRRIIALAQQANPKQLQNHATQEISQ